MSTRYGGTPEKKIPVRPEQRMKYGRLNHSRNSRNRKIGNNGVKKWRTLQ